MTIRSFWLFYSLQFLPASCNALACSTPGSSALHCLPELAESVVLSKHLILSALHLLLSVFPSIRFSASASVLPVNVQGWFPLGLAVWSPCLLGTIESILQQHSSEASLPQLASSLVLPFSYLHMTTGKTIVLTIRLFVGQVISAL